MSTSYIAHSLRPYETDIFTLMTRLATRHGAVNLGQGFPDFEGPDFVKRAAIAAIEAGHDQYAPTGGVPEFSVEVASYIAKRCGFDVDPQTEITVTCGCQEGLAATFLGILNPGDEVVLFQPYYDTYLPCVSIPGGMSRFVTLRPPDFTFDETELRAAFTSRTRAILVNTPHNPSGKIFTRSELELIGSLCREHNAIAVMDEVYENLVFRGEHVRMATLEGMRERTITLSSLAKTFSLTGWKIGWAVGPPSLTTAVRRAHRALTFSTATPLQYGAVEALRAPDSYYKDLHAGYARRRDLLVEGLRGLGFVVYPPDGAYFVLADHTGFGHGDDKAFCQYLVETVGVAAIPPSYFYDDPSLGRALVRFAFCKSEQVLLEALDRMSVLKGGS